MVVMHAEPLQLQCDQIGEPTSGGNLAHCDGMQSQCGDS